MSRKRRVILVGLLALAAVAGLAAWVTHGHSDGMPQGPSLPPQLPEKEFAPDVVAMNDEAVELIQAGDLDEALALLDRAVKEDPAYHWAYVNKAVVLVEQKKYAEAAACYRRLTALRPRAAEYYLGQAFCLQRLGRSDEARERLRYALSAYNLRLDAQPFEARLNRAMVLFLLGYDGFAEQDLRELEKDGADPMSLKRVSGMRHGMEEARRGDRWSILGLDE